MQLDKRRGLIPMLCGRKYGPSGSKWRGGKLKVYTEGKEETAVRQERQVPIKARKSWNELTRTMIS